MIKKILLLTVAIQLEVLLIVSYSPAYPIYPDAPPNSSIVSIFFELAGDTPTIDNLHIDAGSYIDTGQPIGLDIYLHLPELDLDNDNTDDKLLGGDWLFLYEENVFSPIPGSLDSGDLFSWPGFPLLLTPGKIEFYSGTFSPRRGDIKIGYLELGIDTPTPGDHTFTAFQNTRDGFILDNGIYINDNIQAYAGQIHIPIPEPGTMLLFGFGLLVLIGVKKKFN